ncbi:hypothetical protein [Streptomyces sp. NBC_00996]|uniref:hypothetical protein n=1 Tax=Streptomyces sp. NBC_00996 TaxID=2903710 RepID=UPI0038657275|nr:hypothetical protein OG390_00790 [Streptomyces sp. NBC_00996]
MPTPKPAPRSAAASVAVLALTLSACGGTDDDSGQKPAAPKATVSKSRQAPPSGGDVAAGQSVTGKVAEKDGAVTYEIAAEKVDLGTQAEAAKLVQDPKDAKGKVLAVAHVKFTHKSGPAVSSSSDVNDATTVWADHERGAVLIGASDDAAGCEDAYDIEDWKAGESHTLCTSYLVPAAAKNVQVHWSQEDGQPWVWSFPNS